MFRFFRWVARAFEAAVPAVKAVTTFLNALLFARQAWVALRTA